MNRLTIIAFLAVAAFFPALAQSTGRKFTINELEKFAEQVSRQQEQQDNLRLLHNRLSSGKGTGSREHLQYEYSFDISSEYFGCYRFKTAENPWDSVFQIFACEYGMMFHPVTYVLALGYDGSMFWLKGFDTVDFDKLVKYKIGPPDSQQKAEDIARLYMGTVKFTFQTEVLIADSTNLDTLRSRFDDLRSPDVSHGSHGYKVRLFTVQPSNGRVVLHELMIGEDGEVEHKADVKVEGTKELY